MSSGAREPDADDLAAQRFHRIFGATLGRAELVFHVPHTPRGDVIVDRPHIDIFIYRPKSAFALLVTAGMSTRAQCSPEHPHVELYAKLPAATTNSDLNKACILLWKVAQFPFTEATPKFLSAWHLLHTSLGPITPGSKLDAIVLTPPLEGDAPIRTLATALGAELLYAYGLTDNERQQAETWGFPNRVHFVRAMMRAAGRLTDPARDEVDPKSLVS